MMMLHDQDNKIVLRFVYKINNTLMKKVSFVIALILLTLAAKSQRTEITLEKNWKFSRNDDATAIEQSYDDGKWQTVTVPHDWAIYGPFDANNDMQKMAIVQDGQTQAQAQAGRTGGLPFVGVGWYRTKFKLPTFANGKRASIIFDGAMSNAHVYINGKLVGYWPYGYNSFHFDITDALKVGEENVMAVRLDNPAEFSRWYPGAGLYRNVHIVVTEPAHIPVWGTQITTPVITKDFAKVIVKTKIENAAVSDENSYQLQTEIMDNTGKAVANVSTILSKFDQNIFKQELVVDKPLLWDVDHPNLYKVVSKLLKVSVFNSSKSDGKITTQENIVTTTTTPVDVYATTFGIRSIEIVPGKGFFLNGKLTKFKGVCNHHDLGPLGAAVNDAAIRRQVRIMKDMGANAIRTSHNMPAPELVRACDEMGMMLMAESFDEWKIPKMKNSYNKIFDEWAEKDLVNLVRHYRNNPSIVMWSIGNEVEEQSNMQGAKVARYLQDICLREDPTRPVTNGMDRPDDVQKNNMAAMMNVAGFNYRPFKYQDNYKTLPQQIILGSETASTVSSRGIYKFPVENQSMKKYDDHQSSSYDVERCAWSDLPEDNFIMHDDLKYCIGEFVWTGFDYLGEPTPYYTDWPSHSSLFGIVDLAGIPKDRLYLYRSHWNAKEKTLHILPHWNWKGREGEVTPIFVYTNYPSAELFINGKSQGRRAKDTSYTAFNTKYNSQGLERQKRYRLMWMDTKYEPGTVKVIAYDEAGKAVAEEQLQTAGKPDRIILSADRATIKADGKDISFINVKIVDKDGNFCPDETRQIQFKVMGAGAYKAAANGNSISLESFQAPYMKLFSGQLTALVQSSETSGIITFEASAKGVKSAKIKIRTVK